MIEKNIAILGGGSFGTALAILLDRNSHNVKLWFRNEAYKDEVAKKRENFKYLKGINIPQKIEITSDLKNTILNADVIIMAVPTSSFRSVLIDVKNILDEQATNWQEKIVFVNVAKGIEKDTLLLLSQVAKDVENNIRFVTLSGPSHAEEISLNMPTSIVVSSKNEEDAKFIQEIFFSDRFRVYVNDDEIGVQLGGALKNIIAICSGISDGLGFGDNSKSAIITRGLREIARLGEKLGGNEMTFLGLTGVGDLIVTCTSNHSRNRNCGYLIGKGYKVSDAIDEIGMVVEGVGACMSAYELAKKYNINMPITKSLYMCIKEEITPLEAVDILMGREKKYE